MSLKEGKYTKLCKTEPALKAEVSFYPKSVDYFV